MTRRVFVANVVLAAVLAALVAWNGVDRLRIELGASSAAADGAPRVVLPRDPDEPLQVEFAAPMVPLDALGAAPEGTVVLDPAVDFAAEWTSPTSLALVPLGKLRRATLYHVHLDPRLRSLDGRDAPSDALDFATPSVSLLGATLAGDDPIHDRRVVLSFDLALRAEDLREALSVHDAAGAPVGFDVRALPTPSEPAFEVTLDASDEAARERTKRVTLAIDGGLRPAAGGLPMGRGVAREIAFAPALVVEDVSAEQGGIDIELNGVVPLPEAGFVAVDPPVAFQVQRHWGGVRLVGDFAPGAAMSVVLRAGFPGAGRRRLAAEVRRSLRVPDLRPTVAFRGRGDVLSSLADPSFEIEGVNVDEVEVSVRPVYANNLVRIADTRRAADQVCGPPRTRTLAVAAARNERWTRRVDLREFVRGDARGLFLVALRAKEDRWIDATRVLQVTDLGVTVRAAGETVAVRVASIARGDAVVGAHVRVVTPTNQTLGLGTTDERGVAVIRCFRNGADRVPHLVEVRHGDDLTAVDLAGFRVDLADDQFAGRAPPAGPYEAWVAPDRGAVRPGEILRAEIVLRNAEGAAPGSARVEVRWIAPDRRVVRTEERTSPPSGLLVAEFATSPSAPTGRWSVDVIDAARGAKAGGADFVVECFVPDRMEATARVDDAPALGGEGRVRIDARWLDGGAASGRPVRVRLRWDRAEPEPPGLDGFSFGSGVGDGVPPGARDPLPGVLDAAGAATLRFDVPKSEGGVQALRGTARVEVEDTSGRVVRASAETIALRSGVLVGVRAAPGAATIAAVRADGSPWPDVVPMRVWIERRAWEWDVVEDRRGHVRFETREVAAVVEEKRVTISGGRADVAFRPVTAEPFAWFVVVAATIEPEGGGGGARAEQAVGDVPRKPDRIDVAGPAAPVAPGSGFELTVDSPMAGTAFVTLEGGGIHAAEVVPVARGRTTIPMTLPDDFALPNVHAIVTLTSPQARRGALSPFWAIGGTSVAISHPERGTVVTLSAPDEVRPDSELTVHVAAPGATEVVVALVDEGILRITGHPDPDPLGAFLAKRRLDSVGADTGTRLLDRPVFDDGVLFGGDEDTTDAGADERLDGSAGASITTLALFAGPVALDAEGRATCTFKLPPYEGRVRVMAVAAGPRVVGAASTSVVVAAPLGLLVAGPRLLAPGDRAEVSVTVRNRSAAAGDASLVLSTAGGLAVAPGLAATCSVHLAPGASRTFSVPVVAGTGEGTQRLTVSASLGAESRVADAAIAVRPLTEFSVERIGLALPGAGAAHVDPTWRRDSLRARVVVDARPDARLLPAVAALIDYPHGCVEQTASRCVALLAGRALLPQLAPAAPDGVNADADVLLATGVDRLFSMQTDNGGLAMWPGGDDADAFGTLYGLDVLLDAQAQGVRVPAAPLARLVDRAMLLVSRTDDTSLLCAGVDVLSRAGRPIAGWRDRAASEAKSAEDRAHVALALCRGGLRDRAATLLEAAPAIDAAAPRERGGLLRTPVRARAIELLARMECGAADPRSPELVARLQSDVLRPGALTTQEQAHAVRALARWYAARSADAAPSKLWLVAGDLRVALTEGSHAVDLGDATDVRLDGDGAAFAVLELRGRRSVVHAESRGVTVTRTLVDVETGKAPAALRRGGLYEVRVAGHVEAPAPDLLVTDILPGGLEAENPRDWAPSVPAFLSSAMDDALDPDPDADAPTPVAHTEIRDDRVLLFAEGVVDGDFAFRYRVRAVFPGEFAAGSTTVEALYDPSVREVLPGASPVKVVR